MAQIDLTINAAAALPGKRTLDSYLDALEAKAVTLQKKLSKLTMGGSAKLYADLILRAPKTQLKKIQAQLNTLGPLTVRVVPKLDKRYSLAKMLSGADTSTKKAAETTAQTISNSMKEAQNQIARANSNLAATPMSGFERTTYEDFKKQMSDMGMTVARDTRNTWYAAEAEIDTMMTKAETLAEGHGRATAEQFQRAFANTKGFSNEALLKNMPIWQALEQGRRDVAGLYQQAIDVEAKTKREGGSEWAQYKSSEPYIKEAERLNKLYDQQELHASRMDAQQKQYLNNLSKIRNEEFQCNKLRKESADFANVEANRSFEKSTDLIAYENRLKAQKDINEHYKSGNTLLDKRLNTIEKIDNAQKNQKDIYDQPTHTATNIEEMEALWDRAAKSQDVLYEKAMRGDQAALDQIVAQHRVAEAYNQTAEIYEKTAGKKDAAATSTKKEIEALNNFEKAAKDGMRAGDNLNKRGSFWNSTFTKFSVVMSGIAATLFVFQELVQWVRAAADKLIEFETAARNVEGVFGSGLNADAFLRDMQRTTEFDITNAANVITTLGSEGYSTDEIQKNLKTVLSYMKTGFVDASQAMEVATTDIYNLSESLDYHVDKMSTSTEKFWDKLGNQFDRFVRVVAESTKLFFESDIGKLVSQILKIPGDYINVLDIANQKNKELKEQGIETGLWAQFKNLFSLDDLDISDNPSLAMPDMSKTFAVDKKTGEIIVGNLIDSMRAGAESALNKYNYDQIEKVFEDFFKSTGEHISFYFMKAKVDLDKKHAQELGVFSQVGATQNEFDQLKKQQKHENWSLIWDEIFAEKNPLTPYEVKQLQSQFKDTGYYDPRLKRYEELSSQRDYGLFTQQKDTTSLDFDKYYSASLAALKDQLEIFKNDNMQVSTRGEAYYENYGTLTAEYEQYLESLNSLNDEYRQKAKNPFAEVMARSDDLELFKKKNQDMWDAQEFMYDKFKMLSKQYYDTQKYLYEEEKQIAIATGTDKIVAHEEYLEKMRQLDDKYYRTYAQGFKAAVYELNKSAKDHFEQMETMTVKTFNSMEDAFVSFVETGKLDFSSLIDSMIADLARLAFQQMMFGNGNGGGALDLILGGLAQVFGGATAGSTSVGTAYDSLSYYQPYVHHAGGVVGVTSAPTRKVPASTFDGAARLHDGLASDEYPAILQRGETVIRKGGSKENIINVTVNEGQPETSVKQSQSGNITNLIVNLAAKNITNDGKIAKAISNTFGIARSGK